MIVFNIFKQIGELFTDVLFLPFNSIRSLAQEDFGWWIANTINWFFLGVHEQIVKDEEIRKQWNQGKIPKFPFYHNVPTANIKTNMEKKENVLTKRTSELEELFEELKKMKIDKNDDILNKRTTELEQLFNNLKKKYGIDDGKEFLFILLSSL